MDKRECRARRTVTSGYRVLLGAAALFCLAGCAGPKMERATIFYPPPPNLPRIQYLLGINDSGDVEGKKDTFNLVGGLDDKDQDRIRPISKPYGIAERNGKLYVCDTGTARVIVIDIPNKKFEFLKGIGGPGKLTKPVNVAVDRDGFVYVADTGRGEIMVYGPDGEFLQTLGKDLDMKPADVAVDGETVFVLDVMKHEIKLLDRKSGKLLGTIGKDAEKPEEKLSLPTNMTIDSKGLVYVTNMGTSKVIKLDRDGHVIGSFGKMGDGFGQFGRPRGISVDNNGLIYVVDAAHQNVQIFNNAGRVLMFFGDPGTPEGYLNLPAGITISTSNLDYYQKFAAPSFKLESVIFVTSQFSAGNAKISVYGLGKKEGIDYEKEYELLRLEREKKAREAREKKDQEEKLKKEQEEKLKPVQNAK